MRAIFAVLALATALQAQPASLPAEPLRESGQGVTGAFEGWFRNQDGSFTLLLGYLNRNLRQELDIPIGPNNRIEPGGPDQHQPTHFLPGRQWGVFTITLPKDFGSKKLTWTLAVNGQTNSIPLSLNPLWEISPFSEEGVGNTPPVITFDAGGPSVQGPRATMKSLTATVRTPLALPLSVTDDARVGAGSTPPPTPPVSLTWSVFRGPGAVVFSANRPAVEGSLGASKQYSGKASTTATFSEPGEYMLLVVANDWSGDGGRGFQCCWTTAHVRVSVKP